MENKKPCCDIDQKRGYMICKHMLNFNYNLTCVYFLNDKEKADERA